MKSLKITFAKEFSEDRPLAVVAIDDDKIPAMRVEYPVRSVHDALLFAEGFSAGAYITGDKDWPTEPEIDVRLNSLIGR